MTWVPPNLDDGDFVQVHCNAFSADDEAEEFHRGDRELTLLDINLEAGLAESIQHLADMLLMLQRILRVDQDIINVGSAEIIKVIE